MPFSAPLLVTVAELRTKKYLFECTDFVVIYTVKGLFMALQPKIIACGNSVATFAMAVRFLTGPAVMAAASIAVGLRGTLLHIAIVQVKVTSTMLAAINILIIYTNTT